MKRIILFLAIVVVGFSGKAQYVMDQDSSMLLNNLYIQMEVTASVNAMYNAEFDRAAKDFRWLKYRFPQHPLPYFLFGLNEWWKILPEMQDESRDEVFIAYMDTAIYYAENIFDENEEDAEAAFFLAAAHGFKGRLYSERGEWTKAAFSGKSALKYLDYSKGKKELSPELLFGDALYNYYIEWIPENYPILKPVISFFDDGDKELGKNQLIKVSRNAFYTRTEAQYFLMRILALEENDLMGGLQVAEYLHQTFPNNAYFHRFYARLLYSAGRIGQAEEVCLSIVQKIDSMMPGYGGTSGRYAGFFLGQIYDRKRDIDNAQKYYEFAVKQSESIEEEEAGYYLYSLYHLGIIAEKKEQFDLAKDYYKETKKKAKRSQNVFSQAKQKLKEL